MKGTVVTYSLFVCVSFVSLPLGCAPTSFTGVYVSSALDRNANVLDNDPCVALLKPGQYVLINDAAAANKLAGFFPGVDNDHPFRLFVYWVDSVKIMKLVFVQKDKKSVAVYLTYDGHWGYKDREELGDRSTQRNVEQYLKTLLANREVKQIEPPGGK